MEVPAVTGTSSREHKGPQQGGRRNSVILTSERTVMGKTATVKVKNTLYPPFGMVQEHLEGPMQGSKAFVYYIPKGDETGITIVGEYVMSGVSEQQIREAVNWQAQRSFDEDNANLRAMK